jgi:hypothetical protein
MYDSAIDFYHKYYFVIDQICVVRSGRIVQQYVKEFVDDLRQIDVFFMVLQFPPPMKLTATI